MSKQKYALVPVELLKHLSNKDGVDEPITDPKEIEECEKILKKEKTYRCTAEEFIEWMDKL